MQTTTKQPQTKHLTHPRPTILLAGKRDAMDAPGGGEIQMTATARALPEVGIAANLWQSPEQSLTEADCLHLFGSVPEHLPTVEAARRRNVPVVLSTIAWFELANCLREPSPLPNRLAACARFSLRSACPWLPSWRRRLYRSVDLLLPNSNAEAEQLVRYFNIPHKKIHVVPNGADLRFAVADPRPFSEMAGVREFVLCPGRIEPRKNQLALIKAMRGTGVPTVVLGDVVPGYESYMKECRRAADGNVRFVPRLDYDDPLLASAYAACGCLALTSWFETPGLVALEAGMSGTPLVLPEGGSAREYFGPLADYVKPNDLLGIRQAVTDALSRGRDKSLAELVRANFSWQRTAQATREAYERIL